ncbi:unnamed protein product [Periconia digitata]|uniref:Zn(2)-C6 fungal-type domain-containing protein n=1 Tax=Periconia digitata TaxID=1303443 RepID=A0A9W4UHJ2_9PLEO|nr:unnamed protein product [Periconia digitata]
MDSEQQSQKPANAEQTKQKRSRTGCLTCRTRRRKCDEARPQCDNCKQKGLECRYAAAFQILGKHNFTPEVTKKVSYKNLKFVSDTGTAKESEKDEVGVLNSKEAYSYPPAAADTSKDTSTPKEGEQLIELHENVSPSAERYEYALHGLLALGNRNGNGNGNAGSPKPPAQSAISASPTQDNLRVDDVENILPSGSLLSPSAGRVQFASFGKAQTWASEQPGGSMSIFGSSDHDINELLKHYRYRIAPWLDIADMHQYYGCEVLQLSHESLALRISVLALAQQTYQNNLAGQNLDFSTMINLDHEDGESNVQSTLVGVLNMTGTALADLSAFWVQSCSPNPWQCNLEALIPDVRQGNPESNVYWLMTRLQLSIALINTYPIMIPLPGWTTLDWRYSVQGDEQTPFWYAHEAVSLCIDATTFSRDDDNMWHRQRYGKSRADSWRTIVSRCQDWYKNRPQEFQPIIELYPSDGRLSDDEFPTLVFSNGAAVLANQLYHTSMLLLLQKKPRFVTHVQPQSATFSSLWQSHRVCGIAVNNDRWDCWDPCLIASFLVAAKTTTHQSQHSVILNSLEKVQEMTGFRIAHHVESLKHEWQQVVNW